MASRFRFALVAGAALAVLAAGCGGKGSRSSATARAGSSAEAGALAFARCMRAHGIAGWPDPTSGGFFDKAKLRRLDLSVARVRALEEGACNHLLGGGPPQPTITLADRNDYLRAAACMRAHGYPGFPDPTFPNGSVSTDIPASIDQDSAAFKAAASTCTRLIPAGLPYSSSSAR